MPLKKHKPEEIVAKLRQVDVLLSQERPVAEAIRAISVTPFTYYRDDVGGERRVIGSPFGAFPCVERCCPSTGHASRSDTSNFVMTWSMQRRRPGSEVFPEAASRRISFSSVRSETAFRSRSFSFSSSLSRLTWSLFKPAKLLTPPLAAQYGRYGYRRIAATLRAGGWAVNVKRVERIWREGLKVPGKQPEKGRLWLNDGSCVRLRPERPNHVWSYDFVEDRTHNGRSSAC